MRARLALIGVAALAAGVWLFRDRIPGLGGREPEVVAVSPEAADQAERKLERLPQWALNDPPPSPPSGDEDDGMTGREGEPGTGREFGQPSPLR